MKKVSVHKLAERGNLPDLMVALEKHPECLNQRDRWGATPLRWACMFGEQAVAEFLLNNGADMDLEDMDGHTPLHKAFLHGKERLALISVHRGARIDVLDKVKLFSPFFHPLV